MSKHQPYRDNLFVFGIFNRQLNIKPFFSDTHTLVKLCMLDVVVNKFITQSLNMVTWRQSILLITNLQYTFYRGQATKNFIDIPQNFTQNFQNFIEYKHRISQVFHRVFHRSRLSPFKFRPSVIRQLEFHLPFPAVYTLCRLRDRRAELVKPTFILARSSLQVLRRNVFVLFAKEYIVFFSKLR